MSVLASRNSWDLLTRPMEGESGRGFTRTQSQTSYMTSWLHRAEEQEDSSVLREVRVADWRVQVSLEYSA